MTAGHEPVDMGQSLETFYEAVSRAQSLGFFKSHHGPLTETAWLHAAIHDLEDITRLAAEAMDGDVLGLAAIRTLIDATLPWTFETHEAQRATSGGETKVLVPVEASAGAAVAGFLLDRVEDRSHTDWMLRAMNFYGVRAVSLSKAFEAAELALARRLPLEQFAQAVRDANYLPRPAAAHGSGGHGVSGSTHSRSALGKATASTLEHILRSLLETATLAEPAPLVLRKLAESHHIDAHCRDGLKDLADKWTTVHPEWKRFLFGPERGVNDQAVRQNPHLEPILPDTGVVIAPQHFGQWEIAELTATESDEVCPPAQGFKDMSNKIYGRAGDHLIKAQNEITKAQECINGADSRRCKEWKVNAREKCEEYKDLGYETCGRYGQRRRRKCGSWKKPFNLICLLWVWIVETACVLFVWVANVVCVVTAWIVEKFCIAYEYIKAAMCAMGHIGLAIAHAGAGAGGIGLGAAAGTAGVVLNGACKLFGVKPASRTASSLKVVGVHAAVLHTNKVLLFSYDEGVYPVSASNPADFTSVGDSDRGLSVLWDPATKTAKYIPLSRNLFCAHQSFTEHGHLFVAGGQFPLPGLLKSVIPPKLLAPGADKDIHTFDPIQEVWVRHRDMQKGRWYPTCATLLDGRIFISSGTNGYATEAGLGRGIQDTYQIADPVSGTPGDVISFGHNLFHLYPFQHVLPGGKVFIHFKRTTILFDPANGQRQRVAAGSSASNRTGQTNHPYSRTGPGPGTSCLLPLIPTYDRTNGQVKYPAGRILMLGGGGAEKKPEPEDPTDGETRSDGTTGYHLHSDVMATSTAEILNVGEPSPEWQSTKTMFHQRVMPDSILLPNAKVLVIGGGRYGQSGGLLAHFASTDTDGKPDKGATDPVLEPEMYDPVTEGWKRLARKPLARLYHTTAVLLPDARVLVAGHDGALNMPPYDTSRYELEMFSPPYLFGADGQLAPRPVITDAPAQIPFGQAFAIKSPDAGHVASVALIRQSSTTHQINSDQRYVELAIINQRGETIMVQAPVVGDVLPPGYYMLFIVNRSGVPSMARWMRVPAQPLA